MDNEKVLNDLIVELNTLTGLDRVKKSVNDIISLIKIRKLREEQGLPNTHITNHIVFTGNPGTGKTTVARLLAKIYKELGLLSSGHLVETDRSGMVAGFVGQTALKVTEVVKKADGGVLFIDEAYSLSRSNDSSDFGQEAIDTLVKLMEDNRDNLIVIFAGYSDEMKDFINANSGLASRINKYIEFSDYTTDELLTIFRGMCQSNGFLVCESAIEYSKAYFEEQLKLRPIEFGNARGVRNYFEKAVVRQASRLVECECPSKFQLMTIEKEDCFTQH